MKKSVLLVIGMLTMIVLSDAAWAEETEATSAQAKELLQKIVDSTKAEGCDKALQKLNNPKGMFAVYSNVFTSALSPEGILLASTDKPALVGKSARNFRDTDGNKYIQTLLGSCGKGSCQPVEFQGVNRGIRKLQLQTLSCENVDCGEDKKVNVCILYCGSLK